MSDAGRVRDDAEHRHRCGGLVTYSGSRAAVVGMTRPAGKELGPQIGTVNAVAPDVVTGGWRDAVTGEVRAEQLSIPLRRLEIAEVAAFLAGNRASNATGRVIGVDAAMVV